MPRLKDLKLKICGLRDNIQEVIGFKPDYAGFIFYSKSPRYVGDNFAVDSLSEIPSSVAKVGVFVNQPEEEVEAKVKNYRLDYAQLHGQEDTSYCRRLRAAGVKVIKVFSGNEELSREELEKYAPHIDLYLFDTRLQQYGGTGVTFDWNGLRGINFKKPVILSGGLDLANITRLEHLEGVEIHAIDVNSKFEISPGYKNPELIRQLKVKIR